MVNRYIAPGILGDHGRPKLKPAERTALDLSSHADLGASSLVATLLKENNRVRAAAANSVTSEGDTRPISDIISDIPGTFQKSKFFGHFLKAVLRRSGPPRPLHDLKECILSLISKQRLLSNDLLLTVEVAG